MSDYFLPLDIANRALQHVGSKRITALTENSVQASEVNFAYDKLRRAELRRNIWTFATRKVMLRPIDVTTMLLVPATLSGASSYPLGYVGLDDTSDRHYQASVYGATGTPDATAEDGWQRFFGSTVAQLYDEGTAYYANEVVYTPQTTAAVAYISLVNDNDQDPTVIADWDATVVYRKGDTVTHTALVYQSTSELNINLTPGVASEWVLVSSIVGQVGQRMGQNWVRLDGATLASPNVNYPVGVGPASMQGSNNLYKLPNGFLRRAPSDPRSGSTSLLGAPSGTDYADWVIENGYITSSDFNPLMLRFVADVTEVEKFDDMFSEGLAARIALEVCERLTQSSDKLQNIASSYARFMSEARTVNAIEAGTDEPALDDYIACRV